MRTRSTLLTIALLAAVTPAIARPGHVERGEQRLATALAGRAAGNPVDCIQLRDVDSTEIIDRTAIVYRTIGGRVYLNRPTSGLSLLDDDAILLTKAWTPELCSIDIVRLIDRSSRMETGFVSLGKFVPYEKPAR